VPPKGLFAAPRPGLITVPVCSACHQPTSVDDEYFRTTLAFRHDVGEHPDVSKPNGVLAAALRSLERPQAAGFTWAFFDTMREIPVRSPSGLYIGTVSTYDVDAGRICSVVERTIRGLYYHHLKKQLRDDVAVLMDDFTDWSRVEPTVLASAERLTGVLAHRQPQHTIGQAFQYSYIAIPAQEADDHASAWLLRFYSRVMFLGLAGPPPRQGSRDA